MKYFIILLTLLISISVSAQKLIPFLTNNNKYIFVQEVTMVPIINIQYQDARLFNDGLAAVKTNNKYGFINERGIMAIPAIYDSVQEFNGGPGIEVKLNGKWTIRYPKSKSIPFVQPIIIKDPDPYNYDVISVKSNNKIGFYDTMNKKQICLPKYDDTTYNLKVFEPFIAVRLNNKWGFINSEGEEVIEFKYDKVSDFVNGYSLVFLNSKRFHIDNKGREYRSR